jgi:hypothetical protein
VEGGILAQLALTDGVLPRETHVYPAGLKTRLDPYQQSRAEPASLSPWAPGERDKYRDSAPAGYVDHSPITATQLELRWRHGSWWNDRERILASMARCNLPMARRHRVGNCGGGAWIYEHPTTRELKVHSASCGDRVCRTCGATRAGNIAAALQKAMIDKECRFVTLTLRHTAMPLADQIDRIYRCFANLRRSKAWTKYVFGGAAFAELKLGRDGRWHVHLHAIVEGKYLPKSTLSAAWLVCTGDSHIVDVRCIPAGGRVAGYVTKYVTKPLDSTVLHSPEHLDEAMLALRGRRLCLTWGTWRGVALRPVGNPDEGWRMLGRLDAIIRASELGQKYARDIIDRLLRKGREHDAPDPHDGS